MTDWLLSLIGFACGLGAGLLHFLTLRRIAQMYLGGTHAGRAVLLQAGRLALLGAVLAGLAQLGALPLDRAAALLAAFFDGIDTLRSDEIATREAGAGAAIRDYQASVEATRAEISRLQRQTGLISAGQYDALVTETDALAERLRDLEATLAEKSEAVRTLELSLELSPDLAAAALRLHADTEFAALAQRLSDEAAELSRLEGRFGRCRGAARRAGRSADQRDLPRAGSRYRRTDPGAGLGGAGHGACRGARRRCADRLCRRSREAVLDAAPAGGADAAYGRIRPAVSGGGA